MRPWPGIARRRCGAPTPALKQSQAPTVLLTAADIYARAGEDSKAEPLVRRAVQQRPDDLLKKAEPFDRALPEIRYTRATALLMSGRGEKAAQEFRAVLGLKGYTLTDPTFPMAQLGLARGLMLTDKATARTAYQDFFALWKNADPEVPLLKQANAEYKHLQ